ncbi:DUF1697 domain-containing protein [Thalassotalea profundi]|uniref:DUF1697 domain-containing protein n=1 Tax=Thalassotalea profundi TaxID=2036687 RepID=A0ABQ3IYS0_9GAMM|nr:DUF1697 domain-containing protein [Thalassotalea profundi]GHE97995.1 hypothetical protein GCM10011501_29390 [Thalassotalea profundi]
MQKFVILFRGINVGGHNKLPMKSLVPILEASGFKDIQYYIQTGNVILSSEDEPTTRIKKIISQHFNITPEIITLNAEDFFQALSKCPYLNNEGKLVHFYFCKNTAELAMEKIEKYQIESEQYSLINNIMYLYAPEGIGRSKFVANMESCLGTAVTGRNLNTINKINTML